MHFKVLISTNFHLTVICGNDYKAYQSFMDVICHKRAAQSFKSQQDSFYINIQVTKQMDLVTSWRAIYIYFQREAASINYITDSPGSKHVHNQLYETQIKPLYMDFVLKWDNGFSNNGFNYKLTCHLYIFPKRGCQH